MSEESRRVLELVEMSPCPFCGSNKFRREEITISGIRVGAENHDLNGFSVSCDSCMASGPFGKSEHEAAEKWNAPQLARQVEALEAERDSLNRQIDGLKRINQNWSNKPSFENAIAYAAAFIVQAGQDTIARELWDTQKPDVSDLDDYDREILEGSIDFQDIFKEPPK